MTDALAMLNQQPAQFLDRFEYILSCLLRQYLAEDCAQRADIAAQRVVLGLLVGGSGELGKSSLLIVDLPQRFGLVGHGERMKDRINEQGRLNQKWTAERPVELEPQRPTRRCEARKEKL